MLLCLNNFLKIEDLDRQIIFSLQLHSKKSRTDRTTSVCNYNKKTKQQMYSHISYQFMQHWLSLFSLWSLIIIFICYNNLSITNYYRLKH